MAYDGFNVSTADFGSSLRRLAQLNGKSQAETLLGYARTTLSRPSSGEGLLQLTPPSSAGSTGLAAKRAGEKKIDRDLARVFRPVKLLHKRVEQWPDVAGIHRRLFLAKPLGGKLTSDRGPYYVDVKKLRDLAIVLKSHVGRLAAGWLPACRALGVTPPAWIGRHGAGNGSYREALTGPRYEIEMSCEAPPGSPAAELEKRVPYALSYAAHRMDKSVAGILARDAEKAGFKASA